MNYRAELRKFVTSQYIYSGVRIALAIVIPAIILAQVGLLKQWFLFPLGTSFVGLTDMPGPFIRRRNTLILAIVSFIFVAVTASLLKDFQPLVYLEIIGFGMFFSIIGVYGARLASVGGLSLVVLAIFIDGHLTGANITYSLIIFSLGCLWFLLVFLVVTRLQPYKLVGQMIGENYLDLADYLKIKAQFYRKNPDFDKLFSQAIAKQVIIKNHQEDTRETVFRTRAIVNESTTVSRQLMMLFLNSIDLHEKLMTSENDYRKLQESFGSSDILSAIHQYLLILADEITHIGIALQSGNKPRSQADLDNELNQVYNVYYELRNREMNSASLENFMVLRQILMRINEITDEIKGIYTIYTQDLKLAKSLSTGLDYSKFLPQEEKLNLKVLRQNFSLQSKHFRHAIRLTLALLLGYVISRFAFLEIGHSYWILITIISIMRPAFATSKRRNLLRFYGTVVGAVAAYALLFFIQDNTVLLVLLLSSMILCFSLLKANYFWAVLFMTVYIFLTFNFLNPGNVNLIFKDRILDTAIGGVIAFAISYLIFPVWEHTQNIDLMRISAKDNAEYFDAVISRFLGAELDVEKYKIKRKDAIIALANLSDNFQRMISDPKNQQRKLETVHQFVTTSHLITAYTASLAQYSKSSENYPEVDAESWNRKITSELNQTLKLLNDEKITSEVSEESKIEPEDYVHELLKQRKKEIDEYEFTDRRDITKITHLTELKNIREVLKLIYNTAKEQRKVMEDYYRSISQT